MRFQKALSWIISLSLVLSTAALLSCKAGSNESAQEISVSVDMDEAAESKDVATVSDGKKVSIEYTLRLDDGKVVDSSKDKKPLVYAHGTKQLIPGLEMKLTGMKLGESRKITVNPEDAYGHVNKQKILEVKKEQLAKESLKIGAMLTNRDKNGNLLYAKVTEIREKTVILDFNHPMAGKTLHFDVKVVGIEDAPEVVPDKAPAG